MKPNNTVIIYDKDDNIRYTLANQALSVRAKLCLTSQLGNFMVRLPTSEISNVYEYNNVVTWDKVAIWIKDGTINTGVDTPIFKGRVTGVTGDQLEKTATKTITGLDLGEVLLRRIKTHYVTIGSTAHNIIDGVCADLGLGTAHVAANANLETIEIQDGETYFDLVKRVSDYWVSAGVEVKNDFYVNPDFELEWFTRPLRTAGVSTLTYGKDYKTYSLVTDGSGIKNHLAIFGKKTPFNAKDPTSIGRKYPVNGDSWTHDANWVATEGEIFTGTVAPVPKIGANWTKCVCDDTGASHFHHHVEGLTFWVEGVEGYGMLEFWACRSAAIAANSFKCNIYCPDVSNYYQVNLTAPSVNGVFEHYFVALGIHNIYNATTNPEGIWTVGAGSPSWETMKGIEFEAFQGGPETDYVGIDGLSFSYGRWRSLVENGASQTAYGVCDTQITNEDLASDAECQVHGESLQYQLKDPVQRLDLTVAGDSNLLLGDRLPITLVPENLSAANFDIISVEHVLTADDWLTNVSLQGSAYQRNPVPTTPYSVIIRELSKNSDIAKGITVVGR